MRSRVLINFILFFVFIFIATYVSIQYLKKIQDPYSSTHKKGETLLDSPVEPTQESCIDCHHFTNSNKQASHPVEIFGCFNCHQGQPDKKSKESAHSGLIRFPGNLSSVDQTCARCHFETVQRVKNSLMTTHQGMIHVNRFAFGESKSPNGPITTLDTIQYRSDSHFQSLCTQCHLGVDRSTYTKYGESTRGGGCSACHLGEKGKNHIEITKKVPSMACFSCHSRSSRISLNYEGWHETLRSEIPSLKSPIKGRTGNKNREIVSSSDIAEGGVQLNKKYRRLEDGRILESQPSDVHHRKGLSCIDCHTSRETMGDGTMYQHQEDQVEISCEDCHLSEKSKKEMMSESRTGTFEQLDSETQRLMKNRPIPPHYRWRKNEKKQSFYSNVFWNEREKDLVLFKKDSWTEMSIRLQSSQCQRAEHRRVSCQACHSAWVGQCIGCHTEPSKSNPRVWTEFVGDFLSDLPVLGWSEKKKRFDTFTPGMVMTLKKRHSDSSIHFVRLYAPISPHTSQNQSRSCISCHKEPLALGYGRGRFEFGLSLKDPVKLFSLYDVHKDGLPEDAWIEFFPRSSKRRNSPVGTHSSNETGNEPPVLSRSTRENVRPLNEGEQLRVLRVGFCLQCHASSESKIYNKFDESLKYYNKYPH